MHSPVDVLLSGKGCQDTPVNAISKPNLSLKMNQTKLDFFFLPKFFI